MATQFFKHDSEFIGKVIVPDATEDDEAVNKGQLDSAISGNDLQQVLTNGQNSTLPIQSNNAAWTSDARDSRFNVTNTELDKVVEIGTLGYDSDVTKISGYVFLTGNEEILDGNTLTAEGLFLKNGIFTDDQPSDYTGYKREYIIYNGEVLELNNIALKDRISEYLKLIVGYNASTPQVLGHDASGNIQWQAP